MPLSACGKAHADPKLRAKCWHQQRLSRSSARISTSGRGLTAFAPIRAPNSCQSRNQISAPSRESSKRVAPVDLRCPRPSWIASRATSDIFRCSLVAVVSNVATSSAGKSSVVFILLSSPGGMRGVNYGCHWDSTSKSFISSSHTHDTLIFLRKNVGTSRSCPSTIVGSLFSNRPRVTGSNCSVSCRSSRRPLAGAAD